MGLFETNKEFLKSEEEYAQRTLKKCGFDIPAVMHRERMELYTYVGDIKVITTLHGISAGSVTVQLRCPHCDRILEKVSAYHTATGVLMNDEFTCPGKESIRYDDPNRRCKCKFTWDIEKGMTVLTQPCSYHKEL